MGRKGKTLGRGRTLLKEGSFPSPSPTLSPRTSRSRVSHSLRGSFYTAMHDKVRGIGKGMKPGSGKFFVLGGEDLFESAAIARGMHCGNYRGLVGGICYGIPRWFGGIVGKTHALFRNSISVYPPSSGTIVPPSPQGEGCRKIRFAFGRVVGNIHMSFRLVPLTIGGAPACGISER